MTNNIRNVVILSALFEWKINRFVAPVSLTKKKQILLKMKRRCKRKERTRQKIAKRRIDIFGYFTKKEKLLLKPTHTRFMCSMKKRENLVYLKIESFIYLKLNCCLLNKTTSNHSDCVKVKIT